jgi:hypothetical protein
VFVLMTSIGLPAAPASGIGTAAAETMTKVRRALERLPYYGVYDFLAFGIENGVVALKGYAHRPALKREAEDMVRRATGAEIGVVINDLDKTQLLIRARQVPHILGLEDAIMVRAR